MFQGYRRYVLGPDPDERWAFLDFDAGNTIYYPHTDRQGTTIALSASGAAAQKYAYDAYGQSTAPFTEVGPGPASYAFRYTGQRLDGGTALFDYKARFYSPALGRFLQPDPAGTDQGPNLYLYVDDDPVGDEDPTGLGPTDFWDIVAKYNRALTIAKEEYAHFRGHHNDEGDALRHATWSYRTAKEIGPFWATMFGVGHEAVDTLEGQPFSELRMDMHNNTVGVASAETGGPLDHAHLETIPMTQQQYRDFSTGRTSGSGIKMSPAATLSQVAKSKGYDSTTINKNGTITGSVTKTGSIIPYKTTCDDKGHCTTH